MKTKTLIVIRTLAIFFVLYLFSCNETPINESENIQTLEKNNATKTENQQTDGPGDQSGCTVIISIPSQILLQYPTETTDINYQITIYGPGCAGFPVALTMIIKLDNIEQVTVPGTSSYSGTLYNVPLGTHSFSLQTIFTGGCFPQSTFYCLNNTHYRTIVIEQVGAPSAPPAVHWYGMSITGGHINMQFIPVSGEIAQYEIYRASFNPNTPYTLIAALPTNINTFTDMSKIVVTTNEPYENIYAYSVHARGTNGLLSNYLCNPYNPYCWATTFPNCMADPNAPEE